MGSIGAKTNPNIITVIHYTPEENIESLLKNDFDMSRAGQGAGTAWGAGAYYLEKGSYEDDMYSSRLETESYIKSDIDTSGFLTVTLEPHTYHVGKMYDDAAKAFNKPLHREYTSAVNRLKREGEFHELAKKKAFIEVAKKYYPGLILKHRVIDEYGKECIDPISGGNQIVVYKQSAIKNKRKGKNK